MTTAGEWVEQVREHLGGGITEQLNRLASDYTVGDQSLTFQYDLKGVAAGVPMSIGVACFQVWSKVDSSKSVEVTARWAGAPDVNLPAGTIARVKPNFFTHRILDAINSTLLELSTPLRGVWGVAVQDITFDPSRTVYDLSTCEDLERVFRVQAGDPTDDTSGWADLGETEWQHRFTEPTADFPSGQQLRVFDTTIPTGDVLRVVYGRRLGTLDTLDDDVTATALPDTAYDLPVLGAAARLAFPQEFRRNLLNAQPDSRRADEVPPGASLGGARALMTLYQQRVEQEASRIMAAFPPKRR